MEKFFTLRVDFQISITFGVKKITLTVKCICIKGR